MNRKQLEQCAWEKTPRDERRAKSERYDWKTKKTITKTLKGNEREVRVFDPSGHTEGTMSPWMPLWSLYNDELEQRCKEGREPKLRAPYSRTRPDYTSSIEGDEKIAHATRKKSAAQLEREINDALKRSSHIRERPGGYNEYRPLFRTKRGDWIPYDRAFKEMEPAVRQADAIARDGDSARVEERAFNHLGQLVEKKIVYRPRKLPRHYPGA